jgi:hypothetical protein
MIVRVCGTGKSMLYGEKPDAQDRILITLSSR